MKFASLFLSLVLLVAVILLARKVDVLEQKLVAPRGASAPAAEGGAAAHDEEHIEIAVVMGRIQRYHQKFWLASRSGDHALVEFYLHEMEEAMEEIAEGAVVEDGVDVSAHMRTYGLSTVQHLQQLLATSGVQAVQGEGELLVNSCNSCHVATGHEMIRIRVPGEFSIPDQDL
jgi:hypothetical protein